MYIQLHALHMYMYVWAVLESISLAAVVVLCAKHDDEGHGKDAQDAEHGGHYDVSKPMSHLSLLDHCLPHHIPT